MPANVIVYTEGSATHCEHLARLEEGGCALPESWRPRPAAVRTGERMWMVEPGSSGDTIGLMLRIENSRRVLGARIAHLDQLGDAWLADRAERVAALLRGAVEARGRVMRCSVRVLHRDPIVRAALANALIGQGFRRAESSVLYTRTRVLELAGDAEALFEQLPAGTRRSVRRPFNAGLTVRPAVAREDLDVLLALYESSFARRGVAAPRSTARDDLRYALYGASYRRLVVLEAPSEAGDRRIVSWALGVHHGDHAAFLHGASEHDGEWSRLPLAYATIWQLVLWAHSRGAQWFDLGGVPSNTDQEHALGGIVEFKRRFGGEEIDVAEEYQLVNSRLGVAMERLAGQVLNK